jgi:hypothetical protein
MNKFVIPLGLAVGFVSHSAIAKNELTDPLKIARDCKSYLKKFCGGMRPGGLRIKNCLKEKSAELSPFCLDALKATE